MSEKSCENITVVSLVHDLHNKRSIVTLVWDEPDKRIALPVRYGTSLDDVHAEAERAAREFAASFSNVRIRMP